MNDQLLLLVRVLQHDLGAVHVGLDRVHRLLDDQLHADRRGQVEDDVAAVDHLGQQRFVGHRVDGVREAGVALQMADVVDRAGGQVVEHRHFVAVAQQPFGEVRSDEPGASGDQGFHARRCPFAKAATSSATRTTSCVGKPRRERQRQQFIGGGGRRRDTPASGYAANAGCFVNATG